MSLKSTSWYYHRLKAMSLPEVVYRGKTFAVNQAEKYFTNSFHPNKDFAFPDTEDFFARFFLRLNNRNEIVRAYKKNFSKEFDRTISEAEKLLQHRFRIFDCEGIEFNGKVDWHRDFKTGQNWPQRFHANINVYDGDLGGCKYVWELNRHYHLVTLAKAYYLTGDETYAEEVCRQIECWIDDNQPFIGINWYSALELSIRLISWVWTVGFIWESKSFTTAIQGRILPSIYLQASFINRHLSKYSSANNHLIGEAAGLFIIGTIFSDFKEAEKWVNKSAKILLEEALKQINPDGSPGEQATEYLLFVLDFYFLVIRLANRNNFHFSQTMLQRIRKACDFLDQLQDSGDNIPLFGDSDDGRASYLSEKVSHCSFISIADSVLDSGSSKVDDEYGFWLLGPKKSEKPPTGFQDKRRESKLFEDGGVAVLKNKKATLYFDCGPLGYGSMAAHGHADALSLVLTVGGQPVFIDPGTYLYHNARTWREYFRGTSAHNTIRIDGQDQATAAGTFIWSRHFSCRVLSFESDGKSDQLTAEHDGYVHLKDPVIHRRTIKFDKTSNCIQIHDIVDCEDTHLVEQYFHVAPECEVARGNANIWFIERDTVKVKVTCSHDFDTSLIQGDTDPPLGWFSRGFGHKQPTGVLRQSRKISATTLFKTQIEILTMEKN